MANVHVHVLVILILVAFAPYPLLASSVSSSIPSRTTSTCPGHRCPTSDRSFAPIRPLAFLPCSTYHGTVTIKCSSVQSPVPSLPIDLSSIKCSSVQSPVPSLPIDLSSITTLGATTNGFADENGGIIGGAGGRKISVSTTNAFLNAIGKKEPLIIRVKGKIKLNRMEQVRSNKTIIGVGNNKATIQGGGLNMNKASNIIVQNILFKGSKKDAINIEENSKNIWIDHCDFQKIKDGMIDIKRGSDYITVSWNHFIGPHKKTCLLGHSDKNGDQDRGKLRVTYHHNWFDRTKGRHPRVRFSKLAHVYNNYYLRNEFYGVASTEDANVLVEGNHFERVRKPTLVGYEDSGPGKLDKSAIDSNKFVRCGDPETKGSVDNPPYSYSQDNVNKVKQIVENGAGRGLN